MKWIQQMSWSSHLALLIIKNQVMSSCSFFSVGMCFAFLDLKKKEKEKKINPMALLFLCKSKPS